jgi:hypothetical protein
MRLVNPGQVRTFVPLHSASAAAICGAEWKAPDIDIGRVFFAGNTALSDGTHTASFSLGARIGAPSRLKPDV